MLPGLVFQASWKQDAVTNAVRILNPGGKLVLIGISPDAEFTFDIDLMRRKELRVINIRRKNHCIQEAMEMIAGRQFQISAMFTRRSLSDAPQAFDMVAYKKDHVIKVMIIL